VDEVLTALGWQRRRRDRARVVGYILLLSTVFTVGGHLLGLPFGAHMWVIELALWVPWLLWLGWFFPRLPGARVGGTDSLPHRVLSRPTRRPSATSS